MAKSEPPLYMTNWNKFEEAVNDVVRKEMCRVFLWLYRGGATPVWEYLDKVQGGKSGLNKDEKDTLRSGEPATNMDISLLYRLLQRTCGLAEDQSVWHSPPDPSAASLEHTLYLVKKERNKVGHEGHTREFREMSDDELDRKLSHLRRLCADLLTEAARRCGRSGEAVSLVDKMEIRLQEIRGVTADRFVLMARKEKLRVAPTRMADEWYQQPSLRLQGRAVGLADVLQGQAAGDAAPSFLLVSGEAGVGKSSLCRYLEECWLRPRNDGKDLLQRYQLVLRVRCGDICTCDVVRLLKEELLKGASERCSRDTLATIIRAVPILWVLDGLEDATEEAKKLLLYFLRNNQQNSTVLLTSRPEFGQDFLKQHLNDGIQLVTLTETDPLETIDNIILSSRRDEEAARHAKTLKEEFRKLEPRVQQELHNPLKLRLALEDWEATRTSTLHRDFDLSRLYQRITEAQIQSLSEKVSEGSTMTRSEATRKVRKWFSFLCESTFYLVRGRKVFDAAAMKELLKKLEDKCDDLGISSSKCMPTFLASPGSVFSTGSNTYTFYHDSQVHFLAALHIDSVIKRSNDLLKDTSELFNMVDLLPQTHPEPPLLNFFPVLFILISLIDASTPVDEIGVRVRLLLLASPFISIVGILSDVAEKASFEPKIMRKITQMMPSYWMINDFCIDAATKMLEYQQPEKVILLVENQPKEVKELELLICRLASLPVSIDLQLMYQVNNLSGNDTADVFLDIICRKESRCVLSGLGGQLGAAGFGHLRHPKIMDSCKSVKVKVNSTETLETLCDCLQRFQCLEHLTLVIGMQDLSYTSVKLPKVKKTLYFPFLTEDTVANTAEFVARLSPYYNHISVNDMTALSGIETFLLHLEKRNVKVEEIIGHLGYSESGLQGFGFGPLPLEYSRKEFRQRWAMYRSRVRQTQPEGDASPDAPYEANW